MIRRLELRKAIAADRRKHRRRGARRENELEQSAIDGTDNMDDARAIAGAFGLSVESGRVGVGKKADGLHVRFRLADLHVADYWPTSGLLIVGAERHGPDDIVDAVRIIADRLNLKSTGRA